MDGAYGWRKSVLVFVECLLDGIAQHFCILQWWFLF
jgi:hypothetical protein